MSQKTIKILINPDGTVEIDQIGWEGKKCSGEIDDIIKAIGTEIKNVKKQEYYKDNQVHVKQTW